MSLDTSSKTLGIVHAVLKGLFAILLIPLFLFASIALLGDPGNSPIGSAIFKIAAWATFILTIVGLRKSILEQKTGDIRRAIFMLFIPVIGILIMALGIGFAELESAQAWKEYCSTNPC